MPKGVSWTDDQLREAVASSTSFVGVLKQLGQTSNGGSHFAVRRRVGELGLDVSHFGKSSQEGPLDRAMREAVPVSTDLHMVIDKLGLEPSPGNYERIRRRLNVLGLDCGHFNHPMGRVQRTRRTWTDTDLRTAVANARSYAEALRGLGLVPAGGTTTCSSVAFASWASTPSTSAARHGTRAGRSIPDRMRHSTTCSLLVGGRTATT